MRPDEKTKIRSFLLMAAGILTLLLAPGDRSPLLRARAGSDFLAVRPGYAWSFPADHGPHPGYRIEWWYYTGHLDARDGRRFGYQFTIFKVEAAPWRKNDAYPPVLFISHAALADESGRRLLYHETFQRAFPGMAGRLPETPEAGPGVGLFVESNQMRVEDRRHRLDFGTGDFRLELDLRTSLPPIRHGRNGFSQKGPEPENASMYYSVAGLAGSARLRIKGRPVEIVRATGWMDHEFSSNFLGDAQRGWDWFWFELDSGVRLMIFRVRSSVSAGSGDGSRSPGGASGDFYAGTLIEADGRSRSLAHGSLRVVPDKTWRSPVSGAEYPVSFRIEVEKEFLQARAWFSEQELRTRIAGITYWEGPVDVSGEFRGRPVRGRGFVEMTGYAESVGKRF